LKLKAYAKLHISFFPNPQNTNPKKLKEQFSYRSKKNQNYCLDLNIFVYFCQIKISHMQTFGEIIKAEREKKGLFLRQGKNKLKNLLTFLS